MPAQPTLFGWLKGSANVKQERAKTKTAIAPHAAQRRGQDETACLKQHTDTAEFPRSTAFESHSTREAEEEGSEHVHASEATADSPQEETTRSTGEIAEYEARTSKTIRS